MRKGPLTIDSLDRPNAPNPNIPKKVGTDYTGMAMVIGIIIAGGLLFWLATYWLADYNARRYILWIPLSVIGLITILCSIYWIRKIFIFDGLENNTSIFGLKNNKQMIEAALIELAKASSTMYHQNVTYGDNSTTSTSTSLGNDAPLDTDSTFIPMSALLDQVNKK